MQEKRDCYFALSVEIVGGVLSNGILWAVLNPLTTLKWSVGFVLAAFILTVLTVHLLRAPLWGKIVLAFCITCVLGSVATLLIPKKEIISAKEQDEPLSINQSSTGPNSPIIYGDGISVVIRNDPSESVEKFAESIVRKYKLEEIAVPDWKLKNGTVYERQPPQRGERHVRYNEESVFLEILESRRPAKVGIISPAGNAEAENLRIDLEYVFKTAGYELVFSKSASCEIYGIGVFVEKYSELSKDIRYAFEIVGLSAISLKNSDLVKNPDMVVITIGENPYPPLRQVKMFPEEFELSVEGDLVKKPLTADEIEFGDPDAKPQEFIFPPAEPQYTTVTGVYQVPSLAIPISKPKGSDKAPRASVREEKRPEVERRAYIAITRPSTKRRLQSHGRQQFVSAAREIVRKFASPSNPLKIQVASYRSSEPKQLAQDYSDALKEAGWIVDDEMIGHVLSIVPSLYGIRLQSKYEELPGSTGALADYFQADKDFSIGLDHALPELVPRLVIGSHPED